MIEKLNNEFKKYFNFNFVKLGRKNSGHIFIYRMNFTKLTTVFVTNQLLSYDYIVRIQRIGERGR